MTIQHWDDPDCPGHPNDPFRCESCGNGSCDDAVAVEWVTFERGTFAGASHCIGHEGAVCWACADWSRRKGCPWCFR